ncbi:cytochrome b561 [Arboricoccus pini]|uniref:Cytochrome b561 n=1 Tax=Arboricoccus pini TaxID=1963835 RepID=A0A212QY56_9PROT|nr:cytochrome b [Arboricoccus pini]SNB64642.1 cytochrome b561 [Arboricoccus pini]
MAERVGAGETRLVERYDGVTIGLHWLTALLVVLLFVMAEVWGFLPRGTWLRHQLQVFHVSFGILLTAVLVFRLLWKATAGRRLPLTGRGVIDRAARGLHHLFYVLLVLQLVLGWAFRWAQVEEFTFFKIFDVPQILTDPSAYRSTFGMLHNYVAWTIIVLAGVHALAALVHHYLLRDGVLRRMLPGV